MSVDSSGNQKVDFAWGNVPMQPNEDRDGSGAVVIEPANSDQNRNWSGTVVYPSQVLDQALDNHLLVATGHNGYPDYLPNDVDNIPGNIPIPDLEGGTVQFATAQWVAAGFNANNITINYIPNAGGATPSNNGVIASQSPEAGHTADVDHVITLNVYDYATPETQIFAWNLAEYTSTYIEPVYGFAYGNGSLQSELSAVMLSVEPFLYNGGWEGFYLRCTDVAVDNQGVPLFINDGDYLIKYSQYAPGPLGGVQLEVNTSAGWVPFSPSGAWASFISGNMAIIDKN